MGWGSGRHRWQPGLYKWILFLPLEGHCRGHSVQFPPPKFKVLQFPLTFCSPKGHPEGHFTFCHPQQRRVWRHFITFLSDLVRALHYTILHSGPQWRTLFYPAHYFKVQVVSLCPLLSKFLLLTIKLICDVKARQDSQIYLKIQKGGCPRWSLKLHVAGCHMTPILADDPSCTC